MTTCARCGALGDRVRADLQRGEQLPDAASTLEVMAGGSLRRCPECGALFAYEYDYEYGAMGDGWEDATLERLERDQAIALLLGQPPSDPLGVALTALGIHDGLDQVVARVRQALADGVHAGNRQHYEPLRQLFRLFDEQGNETELAALYQHPHAGVRGDVLYLAAHCASSRWFQAARAQTDPNAEVRSAARAAASAGRAPSGSALWQAFLAGLADPDPYVRKHAAWGLAVLLEAGRVPADPEWVAALRERTGDPDPGVRSVVARALAAA